ncbi:FMN-binding glutamate synthase family protein [Methylocystis echinoides]|nr:FMN-binding glutamate synthase family protein [Methylocystis echinoides]
MRYLLLPFTARYMAYAGAIIAAIALLPLSLTDPVYWLPFGSAVILASLGTRDLLQTRHSLLRNYPIVGHIRFLLEGIRPEIRQYFAESDIDTQPFSRSERTLAFERSKKTSDKFPFGTELDVNAPSFEWINHSIAPKPVAAEPFRTTVGGPGCLQPYSISVLNISAMSFGALSANAILALNLGARRGGFAHDAGEGGFSRYHREHGGDIILQVASGYFGCRTPDGRFSIERFAELANEPQIKMIEIKLSQGAKPGHGGVLPASKVSAEIALARGIALGRDCISPARHSEFSSPRGLLEYIERLRQLARGKPVGFKLCVGHPWEFLSICKAMLETGLYPDFIVVDGAEGGTGAGPLEFIDHVGMPLRDGLMFVHNALVGVNLRQHVKLGASGKIITAFDMARAMALGADWCNSARGFMFALGCIQSLRCHTDQCPVGVATQDPIRQRALVVSEKASRVESFHRETILALAELIAAAGLEHPAKLTPGHILKRTALGQVETFEQAYDFLEPGELLSGAKSPILRDAWSKARSDAFSLA